MITDHRFDTWCFQLTNAICGRAWIVVGALSVGACFASSDATAHESRPIYAELTETRPNYVVLQWKVPLSVPAFYAPEIILPDSCLVAGPIATFSASDGLVRRVRAHCRNGLAGQILTVSFPGPNPSVSTLVRYRNINGERYTAILGPTQTTWHLPAGESTRSVIRQYTMLGIEHIFGGVDHLLFVLCLLWIARTWKRIVTTITGFTLAHSTTLALAALELVRLPVAPIEASIALSVAFLAIEIARNRRTSVTWRHPILVSSSFGLLHGFGFASALQDIGLPQREVLTGLLFFNVGVEIGQLLFAAAVTATTLLVMRLTSSISTTLSEGTVRVCTSYTIGSVAVWWMIERITDF